MAIQKQFFSMIQKKLLNDFNSETLNEEILGLFLEYRAMGAISTGKTSGRSTDGVPKKKKWSEHATLPNIKDFFEPRVRNFVENEIEAKYTKISAID